jgi:hypothetical protein
MIAPIGPRFVGINQADHTPGERSRRVHHAIKQTGRTRLRPLRHKLW